MPRSPLQSHRAGIVQIARRLNISPSTVSRALRTETAHLVRADRRQQIRDLADQLHFSPHPGARMLRRGINATLTVVVPLDENIFFSEFYGRFLSGTLHAAAARDWDVHIATLRPSSDVGFRETLQQVSLETAGVIYLGEPLSREEVEGLRGYPRPLVLTKSALPHDVSVADLGVSVVGVDNLSGARAAATLLVQLGHRHVGLVLGPSASRDAYERELGYREVLEKTGAPPRPEWVHRGTFSPDTGRAAITAFLGKGERPTAVCCASDEIAFGALDAARAAGLRCPEDISIVGFDDGPWASVCRPALTTIRQPLADLAEKAVGLIVESAMHPSRPPRPTQGDFPAAIVIRESTMAVNGG